MAEQPGAGRLEPDTLAAYIDGQLPPEERARVEAEIATDPESYEWVVNAVNAVEDASIANPVDVRPASDGTTAPERPVPIGGTSSTKVVPFVRRRAVMGGVGAVLATAAALLLVVRTQPEWWQRLRGPAVDPRFAKLVEAVGEERYIEARLTGGFKYGPLREVMRGPGDGAGPNLQLRAVVEELRSAVASAPSASELHALGAAELLLGEYRAASSHLRASLASGTESASTLNDLAASLFSSPAASDDDRRQALAYLERALQLDPDFEEAVFNQAIVLEQLARTEDAAAAWRRAGHLSGDTPWSVEAERRLRSLLSRKEP